MAKAREIAGLDAEGSYGQAAATIVSVRAREVVDHAAGVLDVDDIERVHDMRVATRRLRAALEIFEPCFPAKPFSRALDEVKELADALGERRDRDIAIDAMRRFRDEMASPDRPGVEGLIDELREEQRVANDDLAPYVTSEHLAALHERLTELIAMARGVERGLIDVSELERELDEPPDHELPDESPEDHSAAWDSGGAVEPDEEPVGRDGDTGNGGVAFADGGPG
jgi:CHAD domain-containing protein